MSTKIRKGPNVYRAYYTLRSELVEYVSESFGLDLEFDCALFMQNTPQTWGSSWLYRDRA